MCIGACGIPFVLAFAITASSNGIDQDGVPQTQPAPASRPVPAWSLLIDAAPHIGLQFIPSPITRSNLDRYNEILWLSEAQRAYLDKHHQSYVDRCRSIERDHVAAMREAAAAFRPDQYGPSYFPGFVRVREIEERVRALVEKEDDLLFTAVDLILSEPQRTMLVRARMHRERSRCMPPQWRGLLASKIDLSRLAEDAHWATDVRTPLEPLLFKYEQAFTSCLVEADLAYREQSMHRERLRHLTRFDAEGMRRDQAQPGSAEHSRDSMNQIAESYAKHAVFQHRLAKLNEQYLPRVIAALSADDARAFEQRYRSLAYPRVYPDRNDPEWLYREVMLDARLSQELRDAIAGQWMAFRAEYQSLCDQMVNESKEWHTLITGTIPAGASPQHNQFMRASFALRDGASEKFVMYMAVALPPEVLADNQPLFDRWRDALARIRRMEESQSDNHVDVR